MNKRVSEIILDKKNLLLILLFTIIIFVPFFVRPSFIGADPYYYLNSVCGVEPIFKSEVTNFVFGLMPCDFLFIKTIMFGLVFLTLLGLGLIVEHFFEKKSFLACFLVYGFSPILFKLFFKLENDLFALPLLVLAILFYFKTSKHKGTTKFFAYSIVSLILLFLSAQFTPFTLFFLYVGAVGNPLYFIILIIGLIIEPLSWQVLFPVIGIAEATPIIGLASIFILFFAWIKPLHKKEMLIATLLVLLQAKFMLFIPFIYAPSLINSFEWLKEKKKINPYTIFGIYAVIGVIAFGFLTLTYFPDQTTLEFSEQSVLLQKDYNIPLYNNWSYGYFVKHYGYPTKYYSSLPQPDYNNLDKPFLALTTFELDCEVLQQEKNLKIYYCK